MATSVLYTIPNFVTAGSGQLLYNIILNLDRQRYRPAVCVSRLAGAPLEEALHRQGVPVFEAPFTVSARPLPTLLSRCRRAACEVQAAAPQAEHFDLWHSFHYLDDYTEPLIARAAGSKFVFTKKNMSWNRRSWWLRSVLAHRIAAQNKDMLDLFFVGRLAGKVEWIPSGVDVSAYRPRPTGSDNGEFTIGCVAHILPVKGQLLLVRSLADVHEARLILAGRESDPDYVRKIREEIEQLGLSDRVEICGQVDEVQNLLHRLDAFAFASTGEGCPVAVLEAMACGLAVVATDVPGNRDLIEDGATGLLVPPNNVAALAEALERLRASSPLREELGARARQACVENFSTDQEAARYTWLYERATASGSNRMATAGTM